MRPSAGAYRTPADTRSVSDAPSELVYVPLGEAARESVSTGVARTVALLVLAVSVSAWMGGLGGAIAGSLAGVALGVWMTRTNKRRAGAVLRVCDGVLHVAVGATAVEARFRLDELADVHLDVKTIERVLDGGSAIPAVRFLDSKVGPKLDTARIVLVSESGREVRLTDEYLPNFDATEWLGKIRVFLRRHGWLPAEERAAAPGDEA